jgi:hypothetical protein
MKNSLTISLLIILYAAVTVAQNGHGDVRNRARNDHSGNLIRVTFHNHGMMGGIKGDQSLVYAGEWPINSGLIQMGNASSFVGAETRVFAGLDSTGDSTYKLITPISFCQGWDPNVFSHDTLGKFLGFEPLPEYYNLTQKEADPLHAVAMSHEAYTWPPYWPDKLEDPQDPGWRGAWNGYFGKDQKNADQESYYVLDDYQFTKKVSGYRMLPPIPSDPLRGGLGLKQYVRGMQWSNPDAEDCIFWIYDIKNIGELNHTKTIFGLNVGASIGARLNENTDYDDDCATFYREIGLTVNYDWDNIGTAGYSPVPWAGFAFLESPGNATDGIDNDGDGINAGGGVLIQQDMFIKTYDPGDNVVTIDYTNYERTVVKMPSDTLSFEVNGQIYHKLPGKPLFELERNGIDDNLNGLIDESDGALDADSVHYYLYIRDPNFNDQDYLGINYITGEGLDNLLIDERRDDGIDNDGDWDPNLDDVGLDGKPGTGDEGEGDGIPTPGHDDLPGESSIDKTDVSESDQIGLTSFIFYEYGSITYDNDEKMWEVSRPGFFDGTLVNVDADYIFSCGYFPLMSGQSEFFSVAMVYGWDEEDIIKNKQIVQKIYDSNYNFAVAPDKPKLKAVVSDQKVTLYWDEGAENSYDRFLRQYDFEGYKIYRSTDPGFTDAGAITDGYGYDRYVKPLAIYDKADSVFGFFPLTFGRGVQFNLGNETGLVHTFVDSPVVNGKRYYYAVTAYDKGDAEKNISPSETNKFVTIDASGIIKTGENVVAVVPTGPSLGYVGPGFDTQPVPVGEGLTQGEIYVSFIEPDSLIDGDQYEMHFLDQSMDGRDNDNDKLIDSEDKDEFLPTVTTGFELINRTRNMVIDTVWIFDYRQQDSTWKMTKDLYADNDGNPRTFSAILNGMEFNVYNPAPGILNMPERSIYNGVKWSENIDYFSAYNLQFNKFVLGGFKPGTEYPRQYKIIFYDELVGKSATIYPILAATGSPIPLPGRDVNFKVFDALTGEEVQFGFVDATADKNLNIAPAGFFSAKDRIIFTETLPNDSVIITMNLLNNAVTDTNFYNNYGRILGAGDTLKLYPDFPFNGDTRYTFRTKGQKINITTAKNDLSKINVVPNPYVVSASWEPENPYTTGRGPREIHFVNLPQKCTIRIYSIDGTLVRRLDHDSPMTNGLEVWDVLSKDNMEIAYGVYVYHVDAPGIGEKVGRIIIIK